MFKRFWQWLISLFKKREPASMPKLILHSPNFFNEKPTAKPLQFIPKEFVKPEDPYFRYGSSYLRKLKTGK